MRFRWCRFRNGAFIRTAFWNTLGLGDLDYEQNHISELDSNSALRLVPETCTWNSRRFIHVQLQWNLEF
jgi:hypothetical protein